MKLQDFVRRTLLDITNGVVEAQSESKLHIAPGSVEGKKVTESCNVNFEIAISVEKEADAGIEVLALGKIGAKGSVGEVNKISFHVPVHFNARTSSNSLDYAALNTQKKK